MADLNNKWEHVKTVLDGERFDLNGINPWDYEWRNTGEKVKLKDPHYGQDFTFSIYEITQGIMPVRFAAGEFSNGVWGIYVNDHQAPTPSTSLP